MKVPAEFDEIRPFGPEDLPAAYERLLTYPMFRTMVENVFPDKPFDALVARMRECKTNLEFQKTFCYPFLVNLLSKVSKGADMDVKDIDTSCRYTFVSNHRDIVLDSGFLSILLLDSGFTTTCEIAIGDNLLSLPWVKDLVRINKSFIVERGASMRQMLVASKRLSEYMHFAIAEKNENVWIAQREGRAKDSDDRTQGAILKMMAMGGEGGVIERIAQLHIVPLSISYEFDPCDFLKAKEFQQKRDNPDFKKGKDDDIISMQTGVMGYKGHIHYHCAPCIDDFLHHLDPNMPKTEIFDAIAARLDTEIHRNYRLYPCNYAALDLLKNSTQYVSMYTPEDKAQFETYIEGQLTKIELPNKDEAYLKERLLTMYANPAINYLATV
jgi:hypothetical protein